MRVVLFIVCGFLPSLLCRELQSEGASDGQKHMLSRTIKRLVKGEGDSSLDDAIAGKHPLNVFKKVDSREACGDLCRDKSPCDTALFEIKGKNRCFLFKCQGGCKFSENDKYILIKLNESDASTTPILAATVESVETVDSDLGVDANSTNISKSNDDGSNRDGSVTDSSQSLESNRQEEDNATTSSALSSNGTATPTVAVVVADISPHSVTLGGSCHRSMDCKDPWAECSFQKCLCQQGFGQKDNVCREECPVGNFECQKPVDGRIQCIPEEKVCDFIQQCADGSDEYRCVDSEKQEQPDLELGKSEENQTTTGEDTQVETHHGLEEQTQPVSKEGQEEKNRHDSDKEGKPVPNEETQKLDSVSKEEEAIDSTHQPAVNATAISTPTTTTPSHSMTTTTTPALKGFILVEKVAEVVEGGDLQVPIIALSVGLIFTLILLLFVACRLCRVRRQLRKSRPLHCNEADYLINGMYL